jgi:enamine deaminase RidA (YjgF/YER057c/UK114 family)
MGMRKRIFGWMGKEFIELSGEAKPAANATIEAQEIFRRFDQELREHGLSLDNTVRSRLWGRDRESRDLGSVARVKVLSGKARSASSSYIAPRYFDSPARVAVDLLAMRPSQPNAAKRIVEYDPPIVPIRFLTYDSVVVLSGVTTVLPTLEEQLNNILPRIAGSLTDAGSSWDKVARVSFYLHRSQTIENLQRLFARHVTQPIAQMEFCFVDGYSAEGKFCEVEVTAHV